MLKIGKYRIQSIETGTFGLDGGAMFGIVPKTIWERSNPADEFNRIDMHLRAMLIQKDADAEGPAMNLLIDNGMGNKWADKYAKIYKIDYSKFSLQKGLAEKGLKPEDITDVIQTHLHFDHSGGLTFLDGKEITPFFPNAKVHVQRRNWDLAWDPTEKDKASYLSENYSPYKNDAAYARKLNLLDTPSVDPSGKTAFGNPKLTEEELYPGISVFVSHGHTLGMQLVRVSDGQTSITYCADLIPTATHVKVPFIMSYDCYPMHILKEKKELLGQTVENKGYLFYEHCPHMAASLVTTDPKGHYRATSPLDL